jgi:two-component system NtrC family sensor kinase
VENRSDSSSQTPLAGPSLYLEPYLLERLEEDNFDLCPFQLTKQLEARQAVLLKGDRLWVSYSDGEYCDYPYYLNNLKTVLKGMLKSAGLRGPAGHFESLFRTNQNIEKKIFSGVQMPQGQSAKDLWDEIIKKINTISNESHSLSSLMEKLLQVPFLQNFESSLIVLHLKGQTKASVLGTLWRDQKHQSFIEVKQFNLFYNSVKKSKIKSFKAESFPKLDLPINGSFLAKEVSSMKYSMVAIASRNDFLNCSQEEIELFETCIDLLQPHFERLIDQEFSDKRVSELRVCLKDFPLPLRIKDPVTGTAFFNDLYNNELQDKDIFFSKKTRGAFTLDLYDSDELRHYAFDLFHFQRISLLGELLNTLRHELSNPLFGLKLGSQIFATIDAPEDSKQIMREIEKNVNRCQVIIENFSNLYQIQNEVRKIKVKKVLDEALVLSKSETRGHRVAVDYRDGTDELLLEAPLIFVVQITFNLIVNASQAFKSDGPGGLIELKVQRRGDSLFIDVIDNGPGISEEAATSLFRPFFTTKPQGTGLGLVLSRNLALKMGGNLEYLVNNTQKGAHFRLTLPLT